MRKNNKKPEEVLKEIKQLVDNYCESYSFELISYKGCANYLKDRFFDLAKTAYADAGMIILVQAAVTNYQHAVLSNSFMKKLSKLAKELEFNEESKWCKKYYSNLFNQAKQNIGLINYPQSQNCYALHSKTLDSETWLDDLEKAYNETHLEIPEI